MIISFILMTSMFVLGLILNGENGYLSLIGVKELNILLKLLFVDV